MIFGMAISWKRNCQDYIPLQKQQDITGRIFEQPNPWGQLLSATHCRSIQRIANSQWHHTPDTAKSGAGAGAERSMALYVGLKRLHCSKILSYPIPSITNTKTIPMVMEIQMLRKGQNLYMATLHGSAQHKEHPTQKESPYPRKWLQLWYVHSSHWRNNIPSLLPMPVQPSMLGTHWHWVEHPARLLPNDSGS